MSLLVGVVRHLPSLPVGVVRHMAGCPGPMAESRGPSGPDQGALGSLLNRAKAAGVAAAASSGRSAEGYAVTLARFFNESPSNSLANPAPLKALLE